LIGSHSIKNIPLKILRDSVGYVSQDPFLFSTSIRENIVLGRGVDLDLEEIVRITSLKDDIERFPSGLDTLIGERGVSLSGGQKQRVALARALITKPEVLILDDAFSSLDSDTEEEILRNIRALLIQTTTLIISHRLSSVRDADKIIVLDEGQIIESGSHDSLIRAGGVYASLLKNQSLAREMEVYL
jgi:ATP-binding cassette subfamily B protein